MLKRILDLILVILSAPIVLPICIIVALAVRATSTGPVLYWSSRVGQNEKLFSMPKFRTMLVGTPALASHLLTNPQQWLTPIGGFLRKSSLDELPQLWSVLVGHMSIVGPRPALFNQDDLISERHSAGVHVLKPGVTGWAQVNGRDLLSIPDKVKFDIHYMERQSVFLDAKIILLTVGKLLKPEVSH